MRSLIKIADVFIIAFVITIAIVLIVFNTRKSSEDYIAVITVDGHVTERINLKTAEDRVIVLDTSPVVTLEIKNSKIAFVDSLCPDSTCEKCGYLQKPGDTAACVPAKTIVTITGESVGKIDAVVG